MKIYRRKRLDFGWYLMIISILGYLAIFTSSVFELDIGPYVDASLFLLIGLALMISGGIKFFFKYFKDGLTPSEINRMVTIIIGVTSAIVGIVTIPFFGIEAVVLNGIKAVIAAIAIVTIIAERLKE